MTVPCPDCGHGFHAGSDRCPHCGRPSLFPNVEMARDPSERAALEARYQDGLVVAAKAGASVEAGLLDDELATHSKAVFTRHSNEVVRLATADRELYATYYEALDGGIRLPHGDKWDVLRRAVDSALFPGFHDRVRFGALTLDERGIRSYGDCDLLARDSMISHRATVFEQNSVTFVVNRGISVGGLNALPGGYRAEWRVRGHLGVAKLAHRLAPGQTQLDFAQMIVFDGTPETDDFLEVHVYGPMTIRTFEKVTWHGAKPRSAQTRALRAQLTRNGATLEIA